MSSESRLRRLEKNAASRNGERLAFSHAQLVAIAMTRSRGIPFDAGPPLARLAQGEPSIADFVVEAVRAAKARQASNTKD